MCIPSKMPVCPSSIASIASERRAGDEFSPAAATALHAGPAADTILSAEAGEAKQSWAAPEEPAAACHPKRRVSQETGAFGVRACASLRVQGHWQLTRFICFSSGLDRQRSSRCSASGPATSPTRSHKRALEKGVSIL